MPPERRKQIEDLYHAALEREPPERGAFLTEACGEDEELRREVESLLAQPSGESTLHRPASEATESQFAFTVAQPGHYTAGDAIAHYQILAKLGEGGMGVVYRALDTRLKRPVAIKVLAEEIAAAAARRRFQREARMASSLNHPHIVTVYDAGELEGRQYLVTEFVDGGTLRDWARAEKRTWRQVVELLVGVADGLAAAHAAGILHRDIKPANILVAKNGYAKLADFGLAKLAEAQEGDATRTLPEQRTVPGTVIGTVAYMSPEQASGRAIDARSDIFSFGVVLYEVLAARRPFAGATDLEALAAIIHGTPQPLGEEIPPALRAVVEKALEKDPAERYQSLRDMVVDLRRLTRDSMVAPQPSGTTGIAKRWKVIAPAAVAVLASVAAGYFYLHRTPKLTEKDTIVLADFVNTTGDPVFDGALRQGLAVQLEQSPFLSLVSEERIQKMLGLMSLPADARLTPGVARDICARTASAAVLQGSIVNFGSQYVLGLRATSCVSGDVLDEEQVQAARREDILNALSQIASKFRTRVGESLASVHTHDTPLAEATTTSLEALRAYSLGWKVHASGDPAVPYFERAIQLDPQFAMAHASLGLVYGGLGESDLSSQSTSRAYQLRDRASDREKFFIDASYHRRVTGNLEKARRTCELWAQTYPREMVPHDYLAAIYPALGKYEQGVEEAQKAIAIDPDFAIGYALLTWNDQLLGRLEEAGNTLRRASERKLALPDFLVAEYEIAFLRGDQATMQRAVDLARGKTGVEDGLTDHEAFVLAYSGHLQQAIKTSRRAAVLAQQSALRQKAPLYQVGAAVWQALFGNASEGVRSAREVLELSREKDVEYGAALALALSGEPHQAQTLATDLEKRFGEDTSVTFSYLPVLRAVLALKLGEPSKAIDLLQPAASYELGVPHSGYVGSFGALYPVYVRGQAYLAAHQGTAAAADFQKILDHRGIVGADPIGALARWRLGQALALSGDTAKAKTGYQDFLTLWKDADPGIPVLQQAKAEYAKLP